MTCQLVDFAIPVDHKMSMKETEKTEKFLNLYRVQQKMCYLRMTVIKIVVGVLGMVPKYLGKNTAEIENHRKNRSYPDYRGNKIR